MTERRDHTPAPLPAPLVVGGVIVSAGQRRRVEIPISRIFTEAMLTLSVEVLHGVRAGLRVWISAAIHGDELNGVEIIRRVLGHIRADELAGSILAVPIVNVFGFISQSRYLPDRRDLNRSFPGSPRGSMASRLAHLFMEEVVGLCTHGIDLHTGANHRTNLPHVRADLQAEETRAFAEAFAAPVTLDTRRRDGSLREAAHQRGIPVLVYEAGEPLRFDETAITVGTAGVLRTLSVLGMTGERAERPPTTREFRASSWVRARRSGILRLEIALGAEVTARQQLGTIGDAFGDEEILVRANESGMVIGHVNNPLVHQGDAVVHIAHGSAD